MHGDRESRTEDRRNVSSLPTKATLLRWLRWLHVMVGLQATAALLVYALSGLAATSHARPDAEPDAREVRTSRFEPRAGESDVARALRLHDELAIPLTLPPPDWVVKRDAAGAITWRVYTPNGMHHVFAHDDGTLRVELEPFDLGKFLLNLHAYTVSGLDAKHDPRLVLWSIYNHLGMLTLGGLVLSGVAIWLVTRPRAVLPLAGLVAGSASCAWIVWRSL